MTCCATFRFANESPKSVKLYFLEEVLRQDVYGEILPLLVSQRAGRLSDEQMADTGRSL